MRKGRRRKYWGGGDVDGKMRDTVVNVLLRKMRGRSTDGEDGQEKGELGWEKRMVGLDRAQEICCEPTVQSLVLILKTRTNRSCNRPESAEESHTKMSEGKDVPPHQRCLHYIRATFHVWKSMHLRFFISSNRKGGEWSWVSYRGRRHYQTKDYLQSEA